MNRTLALAKTLGLMAGLIAPGALLAQEAAPPETMTDVISDCLDSVDHNAAEDIVTGKAPSADCARETAAICLETLGGPPWRCWTRAFEPWNDAVAEEFGRLSAELRRQSEDDYLAAIVQSHETWLISRFNECAVAEFSNPDSAGHTSSFSFECPLRGLAQRALLYRAAHVLLGAE